jgi:hypothetical protein
MCGLYVIEIITDSVLCKLYMLFYWLTKSFAVHEKKLFGRFGGTRTPGFASDGISNIIKCVPNTLAVQVRRTFPTGN